MTKKLQKLMKLSTAKKDLMRPGMDDREIGTRGKKWVSPEITTTPVQPIYKGLRGS
jgi:hypothetical protein